MNKGREFWAIRSTRDNYDLRTIKPKWEEIPLGYERIHLIEYQAYKKAVDCIRKMVDLREEACHDLGEKTLKELGEHE